MKLPSELPPTPPIEELTKALVHPEIARLDEPYYNWDELRRRPLPEGLSAQTVWHVLRLLRSGRLRSTPQLTSSAGAAFRYQLTDRLMQDILEIEAASRDPLGLLESEASGERTEIILNALMEEGIHSSLLEGAATTRERAKEMLRRGLPPKTHADIMIANNYQTMRTLEERCKEPLTPEFVLDLHRLMTAGTLANPQDAGRLRSPGEDRVRVCDPREGTILHTPPRAAELPARLDSLCTFANANEPFLPAVVRAAFLHFQLAYDHPFVDGNGRTARAIFYWCVLNRDHPFFRYLTISRAILSSRAQYARAYLDSEQTGDLTYFLKYHMRVVRRALEDLVIHVRATRDERRVAERALRSWSGLTTRQQAILGEALRDRFRTFTATRIMRAHGVTRATALADLHGLVARNLFEQSRSGKELVFRAFRDLRVRLERGETPDAPSQ